MYLFILGPVGICLPMYGCMSPPIYISVCLSPCLSIYLSMFPKTESLPAYLPINLVSIHLLITIQSFVPILDPSIEESRPEVGNADGGAIGPVSKDSSPQKCLS